MKKRIFIFIVFTYSLQCYSQETETEKVTALLEIDGFGNLFVNESFNTSLIPEDTLVIDRNILIHNKYADLVGDVRLDQKSLIQYIPKKYNHKSISYVVNLPKGKDNNYLVTKSLFLTTIEYLALDKNSFFLKKRFDIDITLPSGYNLIYPNIQDLNTCYYSAPPIIAGEFIKKRNNGFKTFYPKEDKEFSEKVNNIINVADLTFEFHKKIFGVKNKPKLVFIPLKKGLYGRTFENIILLSSSLYKKEMSNRLVSHEMAHIWWGEGGLTFKNKILTEGVAEFMALEFLKSQGEFDFVEHLLNMKFYQIEGARSMNDITNIGKDNSRKKMYSYDFAPLIFNLAQSKNPNFYYKLAEFYKKSKNKRNTNIQELEEFLLKNNFDKLVENKNLSDFFIRDVSESSIAIHGITDSKQDVIVKFIDKNNNSSFDTLSFSSDKSVFYKDISNIKKVVIDPDFKTLQYSRLNDIWIKNESSLLSKNRYFTISETKKEVVDIASNALSYLDKKGNDAYLKTLNNNIRLIKELKDFTTIRKL